MRVMPSASPAQHASACTNVPAFLLLDRYTMATATKVGPKYQVVIPKKVREAKGLKPGDLIEAEPVREGILLRQKVLVDRGLEEALAKAMADVKAGRVSKPYRSARALVRDAIRAGKKRGRRARKTH